MALRALIAKPGRRRTLLTGFLAFALIGASQAFYGPAFPALRERFGVGVGVVGWVVSSHFVGSFVAIAGAGLILTRFGYRGPLTLAALTLALGSFGIAASPSWTLTLAAALAVGLGFGLLDVGVNLLFVRSFERGRAPALNLLNAFFGLGAVLGPLLVGAFLPALAPPFLLAGAAALALTLLLGGLPEPARVEPGGAPPAGALLSVAGFVLFYFLYVASEVGVASWEVEYLGPVFGAGAAARFTALYWGALTVGRLLATPLSAWVKPRRLVLASAAVAFVGALAAHWEPLAPYAYMLVGFAFAPMFPTALVWLDEVFPRRAERIAPLAVAAANLGPVVTAPLVGAVVEATSRTAIAPLLALFVALLLVTTAGLAWRTR